MPLEDWVAPSTRDFTAVVQPAFIEPKLFSRLAPYHPQPFPHQRLFFRLDMVEDAAGQYASFVTSGSDWNSDWLNLLSQMRMELGVYADGKEYLQDSNTKNELGASGLRPYNWRIEKVHDFQGRTLFQEVIDWTSEDSRESGISTYGWIPY